MKHTLFRIVLTALLASSPAFAQMPGMGPGAGMDPAMTKLFGENKAFTASAEFSIKAPNQSEPMVMGANFSMSDGKTRVEMDMTQMKGTQLPPNALASMKQMGMDKMVMIARPDKKITYMVYPNLHAYAGMPMTDAQAATDDKGLKMEKTSMGKESIDGHACEKNKVLMTDAQGATHEVLVWNAADLKDFPVKMQMTEKGNSVLATFKNIKLEKPDATLFEAPAGLTKYDDVQTMVQTEMMKHTGGGAK